MPRPSPEQLIKACLLQSGVQTSGTSTLGSVTAAAAGPALLPSLSLCCCRSSFHTLLGLRALVQSQCMEQEAWTGHLNLERHLISPPKINSMQSPRSESRLVQGIWNRMWRFSPLARCFQRHCNTSPQDCWYIRGTGTSLWLRREQLVLTKHHWEGWNSPGCHRAAEQTVLPGGARPYRGPGIFTPWDGALGRHGGAGSVASPSE